MSRMKILSRPIGLLGALALSLGGAGCGSDEPEAPVPAPEIVAFEAEPGSVSFGDEAELRWETRHAVDFKILDGRGLSVPAGDDARASEGAVSVMPASTTTYRFVAVGADGTSVTAETTVMVVPFPLPTIELFRATPEEVAFGGDVTLSWRTSNAASIVINDSFGRPVNLGDAEIAEGSVVVNPKVESTYTLIAEGKGGDKVPATVSVRLAQNPSAWIKAVKGTITHGETTELEWGADLAEHVEVRPEGGEPIIDTWETMTGTNLVRPERSTIYVITATGRGGTKSAATAIHVAPKINSFTYEAPGPVRPGEKVRVSWSVVGATAITITNESGYTYEAAANQLQTGFVVDAPVTMTGSFTMKARSGDAETIQHLSVELAPEPRVREFIATPAVVNTGDTTKLSWFIDGASRIAIEIRPAGLADHIQGQFMDLVGLSTRKDEVEVQVDQTTTYKMTAYGGGQYLTTSTVTVEAL
ncbi:MAG TPA: hypothetical protein VGD74_13145 [Vulgatibacter sp.]